MNMKSLVIIMPIGGNILPFSYAFFFTENP